MHFKLLRTQYVSILKFDAIQELRPVSLYVWWWPDIRVEICSFNSKIKISVFYVCNEFLCRLFLIHIIYYMTHNRKHTIKIIILPVVLYGSLTIREAQRLVVFMNRVLRRKFRLKRDEVTGGWRKLRNKVLHNLYPSLSIITTMKSRRMRPTGHVAWMGAKMNAYRWESQKKRDY
jgi:hypothetical protein